MSGATVLSANRGLRAAPTGKIIATVLLVFEFVVVGRYRLLFAESLREFAMSMPDRIRHIEVEEYLEGELHAELRHEYLDGQMFAVSGAGERHNRIAGNLYFQLRSAARGGTCGVFMSDMKARIDGRNLFYYPDVMLVCDPSDDEEYFKRRPCLIAEVSSPSTEMVDRREKLSAYRELQSLRYYLLIAAERREVEYFVRDSDGEWKTARLEDGEVLEVVRDDYRAELRIGDLYEDVRLES